MTTTFPTTLETRSTIPGLGAKGEIDRDAAWREWATDALVAIENALGVTTSPAAGSVEARLDSLELVDVPYADVVLSASELNGLAAANIELVAAPAAGFAVVPVAIHLALIHGGTDFVQTNAADHLAIRYSATTELAELGSEAQCTALLEASADAALYVPLSGVVVPVAATALDLDNNGVAEYTTGDGALHVRTWYRTVPLTGFAA